MSSTKAALNPPGRPAALDFWALTKPRIMALILTTGFMTILLAADGLPPFPLLLAAVLGTALASASANTFNMYFDRDIDAIMSRTRSRPLPAGRVEPAHAFVFGVVLGIASFVLLSTAVNLLSAVLAVSGILFYVLVYTLGLKRRTPQNIVIGGAAGAVPPLIGWAAVTGTVEWPAILLFAIIFFVDAAPFLGPGAAKERGLRPGRRAHDARGAGRGGNPPPDLPVHAAAAAAHRRPVLDRHVGLAVPCGRQRVGADVRAGRRGSCCRPSRAAAARDLFKFSNYYLALLFTAVVLDRLIL